MCRSAADCALMLGSMAGYDPRDPTTSVLPVPDYAAALTGEVKGLRIGLLRAFFLEGAGPAQRAAVEAAAKALEGQGATVELVDLTKVSLAPAVSHAVLAPEAYAYHEEWLKTRAGEYGDDVRERLRVGAFVTGAEYLKGQRLRTPLKNEVDAALARLDVLLAPSTAIEATPVGQNEVRVGSETFPVRPSLIRFTRPFNLTGHPAASVPCGFTAEGLPMGLQIIGRPFDEATVLRVADAYQRLTEWHTRRPAMAV
jgi:aspartyl-tRNA(Asn)/glutamyl-tRNA(Gln) amidotransferase subunit A